MAAGEARPDAYQPMAKWVADNAAVPRSRLGAMDRLDVPRRSADLGALALRDRSVDLGRIDQNLLVVTAAADHIAPRDGTMPIFDLVSSEDVTHLDRPGGHIGLIAGSSARKQLWPELAALADRALGAMTWKADPTTSGLTR